jgi:hypothetical protein
MSFKSHQADWTTYKNESLELVCLTLGKSVGETGYGLTQPFDTRLSYIFPQPTEVVENHSVIRSKEIRMITRLISQAPRMAAVVVVFPY